MKFSGIALAALPAAVLAVPAPPATGTIQCDAPSVTCVTLPSGTVAGSVSQVENFNGIPYADPPVESLRLRPPKKLSRELGLFDATGVAAKCPQMPITPDPSSFDTIKKKVPESKDNPFISDGEDTTGQEDCLTISVQRPKGTKAGDKLPVLFYIFGGAFVFGSTSANNASDFIQFAEAQNQKFVFVGVNYRVAGFGFLGGAEILKDGSANLGLLDQRMGLEWVADNIASFGGDPDKVTIWGQSAGSMSVFDQMALYDGNATYNGKALFRSAIMNSGSITPTDPVDCPKAQAIYNAVVEKSNCTGTDTLDCLRRKDFKTFYDAVNSVPRVGGYTSLALSYLPRPDGKVLTDSPDVLVKNGRYHAVPVIIGDQEDEGTIFALAQTNVTSTERLVDYLSQYYFAHATKAQITEFVGTYSPDSSAGSPFRTGILNEYYELFGQGKGFKRVAALLGDFVFTLTRRITLEAMVAHDANVPAWSYLSSFQHLTPYLGTAHGSDVAMLFSGTGNPARSGRTYYLNFLHNQDPNVGVGGFRQWPKWADEHKLLWIQALSNNLLDDNFRAESYEFMKNNTKILYF
ncbi:Carboxylic ester hydrolase [Tolypocladium paradoxum]|uniref:Carboxylic ester hydrolase n=1 Tax=Tolypocladium paradoxum TaxID=94208 RepID=A0A2S4KU18_9HYPO|nr:Carboxylic ester hydrolase [Tolypocladium paradoxum]